MTAKNFEVNERLAEFTRNKGLSQLELSKRMGMSQQNINYIFKQKYQPGPRFLEAFLNSFPDVNPAWLLRGDGPMELTDLAVGTIGGRVGAIMTHYNLSVGALADIIKESPETVAGIVNDKIELSVSQEQAIVTAFPDIREDWLLRGTGSMRQSPTPKTGPQVSVSGNVEVFTLYVRPGAEFMIRIVPKS
jgi:plasmid maintenance system antidote protein VapI